MARVPKARGHSWRRHWHATLVQQLRVACAGPHGVHGQGLPAAPCVQARAHAETRDDTPTCTAEESR